MLKNYLKIAFRNIIKHRIYSFINIAGLSIGLCCCLLIFMYVRDELSYENYNKNADQVYRVYDERISDDSFSKIALTPPIMAASLKQNFSDIQETLRLFYMSWNKQLINIDENQFYDEHFWLAEPNIFYFFQLKLLKGNTATALVDPYSIILSKETAERFFGNENPLGKTLKINNSNEYKVTGILADIPGNFHLKIDMLGSFSSIRAFGVTEARMKNWVWQQFYTYIQVPANYNISTLENKLPDFIKKNADPVTRKSGFWFNTKLQPLKSIHLHSSDLKFDFSERGDITYVTIFSIIAIFILLLACINFMNLTTSRSSIRSREIGIRKIIGARRSKIIMQFFGESIIMTSIAMLLAVGIAELVLPYFNAIAGKTFSLTSQLSNGLFFYLIGFSLLVGIISGSYPALYLSAFNPLKIIKGESKSGKSSFTLLRKILVVVQFSVSIFLLVGTIIVSNQLNFALNKSLGFDKEQVVVLPIHNGNVRNNYESVKAQILKDKNVISATACYGLPGHIIAMDGIQVSGTEDSKGIRVIVADQDYIKTLGMNIVAGRDFSKDFKTDETNAYVINESAVNFLGFGSSEDAIGKDLNWSVWGTDSVKHGKIIGVVKDFKIASIHNKIEPVVIQYYQQAFSSFAVRIKSSDIKSTLANLKTMWKRILPEWPFEYSFLDQDFAKLYNTEQRLSEIVTTFSFLAIFIACLGLLGLVSYATEMRSKEIGIRKVLGASSSQIIKLIIKEFTLLILISNIIAWPVAYLVISNWLENFAYRVNLNIWVFLLSAGIVLLIALFTVSFQSIKAANSNPVKVLKYE